MKLSKVVHSACAAALAFAVVVPGAAQAGTGCTWVTTDLPLPDGADVYGFHASSDGVWVASDNWGMQTVVWQGNQPRLWRFREQTIVMGVSATGTLAANTDVLSFRLSAAGVREVLQPLPGTTGRTWVTSINAAGDVAGSSGSTIVVWPAGSSTPRALPNPDNRRGGTVRGIDDEGRVIAQTMIGGGDYVGYLWDRDGNAVRLETLPGHNSVTAVSVRGGRVVGTSGPTSNFPGTAVEWGADGRIVRELGPLFPHPLEINTSGDVTGGAPDRPVVVVRANGEIEDVPGLLDVDHIAEDGGLIGYHWPGSGPLIPRRATCQA
ncbi:hypothetical protein C8D88_102173 [Lentzea atacamensis]|uniref:YD repeat-containing protein n=1 Tax=Lentzea atacamensis TaxID=531938 RepID=A0A316I941_9PSEU|nr:hypothetical protein [Lentzea atacamensis]PWK88906.1 hypothetical protein C8D88_102173 [Lentzea atacamensis]